MNNRGASTTRRLHAALSVLIRAGAVAGMCVVPLAVAPPSAGAQTTVPPDVVTQAERSIGAVVYRNDASTGWVAADGVVFTSNRVASDIGRSVSFIRQGESTPHTCYVARIVTKLNLSIVRCDSLTGPSLKVSTAYPAAGTPVAALSVTYDNTTLATAFTDGTVLANDVDFMNTTRPRLSTDLRPAGNTDGEHTDIGLGVPVIGIDGRVVSTIMVAPDSGGPPLGTVPRELTAALGNAKGLPSTFGAAAVLAVARRALIPVIAGLALGIIWSVAARDGKALSKIFGLASLGVISAVAYTFFTLLVVGPETLIG